MLRHFLTTARVYDLQWECQFTCVCVCWCLTVFDATVCVVGYNVSAISRDVIAFLIYAHVVYNNRNNRRDQSQSMFCFAHMIPN